MAKPAVFLDGNGVFKLEMGHIRRVEDLHLIPGIAHGVRKLNDLGLFCCLVCEPLASVKGDDRISPVDVLHDYLCKLLHEEAGAKLNAFYYCPYLSPTDGSSNCNTRWSTWRKPNTGMLVAAAWQHDLALKNSFLITDRVTDIHVVHNAGLKGILLKKDDKNKILRREYQYQTQPVYKAKDFNDAIKWISEFLNL